MNEEALKDAHGLFTDTGYNGSMEQFSTLMRDNEEARNDAFKLFTDTGYNGTIEDFSSLIIGDEVVEEEVKEEIKEIPSTKKPEVKEKEVIKKEDKKDISFEDFDGVSEEDLVVKLRKQYGFDRFEFDQDTPGSDVLQIYDTETEEYHHLSLNTKYNRDKRTYKTPENAGLQTYTDFLKIINTGKEDKVVEVSKVKDGKIVKEVVQKEFTGGTGTGHYIEIEVPTNDNPYIADPGTTKKINVEVPQHYVDKAIDAMAHHSNKDKEWNTSLDAAIQHVYEEDKNMEGALRFQNQMMGEQSNEDKEINALIQETVTPTGDSSDFIANPFSGEEDIEVVKEEDLTWFRTIDDKTRKDPIIDKYYKLGLPTWSVTIDDDGSPRTIDKEAQYQQAKLNLEKAEKLRDLQESGDYEGTAKAMNIYRQALEQYTMLTSEREEYLTTAIDDWLENDPIGQRVFDANQAQLEKEVANSDIDEITNNVKLNNPDASDEEIKSIVDDQIESGIEEGVVNAFNANSFGEGLDSEQKNIINGYYNKFTTRTKELNTNRSEAIVKYMSEGKSPAYARELANKDFPVTQEDIKLQNEYLSYVQQVADDDNLKIYKTINGNYEDVSFSKGTLEERANPDYYKNKIKEYQYEDPDFLNRRIYANNNKLIALAKQLETRNSEWIEESSVAQTVYNLAGEIVGSDESLAADIRRFSEIANTGKLPDNLTTIPNSNSPLVKAWNDAVENRAVLGMGKMLNVNLSTLERESASVIMSDVLPAFDAESLSPNEARRRWFEQMQADGIILNKEQKFQMNEQIDSYEKAFGQVPDLFAMGTEMGATFLMTGGAGNVANLTKTVIGKILQQGVKVGLNPKVIQSVTKYASAVATEVYALEGSSFSRENIFDKEGMSLGHNIRLATTLNLGRGIIAKTGDMYTKAIINTAKKQAKLGNKTLQNVVNFARTTPGLESFTGAISFGVTKPLTAATLLQVEGGIENIVAGESFNKLWHDITDGDALMETYGAMLTMQLSHPTAAWKGAVETFRREVDRTRGDNPAWNSAYRELGLKPKKGDEFHTKEDVDNAVNEKIKNIENSNLGKEQKQELIDYHKRLGGKLNMKPAMIELSKSWEKDFKTSKDAIAENEYKKKYDELSPEQKKKIDKDFKSDPLFEANENLQNTIKSLEGGNSLDATDVMNLSAAGKMNGNVAPVTELMSIGYSQQQALSITTEATRIAQQTRTHFSQNPAAIASKQGREFTNNLIELNKRQSQVNNLENILTGDGKTPGLIKQFGENSIEVKEARKSIEQANKAIEQIQENLSNSSKAQWEKENLDFETIEDAREAGTEVVELKSDVEVKEFYENFPDKSLSETAFGYQGKDLRERIKDEDGTWIDNPNYNKAIFIVNTKRVAEKGVKGTAIHEIIGHGTTEIVVGDAAINKRTAEIIEENPKISEEKAKEQATNEKLDYIDNVRSELKKRGQFEKVEEEMEKRPGYIEYREAVEAGGPRDIMMEKEFLAEFVQLAEQKAFAGSKGIRGEITEITSLKPSSKPNEWVDFVLKGGTTAKGGRVKAIEESIKELDILTEKYGTKDSKGSASEKVSEKDIEKYAKNEDGTRMSKKEWDAVGRHYAKADIPNLLKGSIGGKLQGDYFIPKNSDIKIPRETYVEDVMSELYAGKKIDKKIDDFNPERNDNFSGYLGALVEYAKKNVFKQYEKDYAGRKSTDTKYEGGREVMQMESKDLNPEEAYIAKQEAEAKSKRIPKEKKVSTKKVFTDTPKGKELLKTYEKEIKKVIDDIVKEKGIEGLEDINQSTFKGIVPEALAEMIGIRPEVITDSRENVYRPKQELGKEHKGKKKIGKEGVEWGEAENLNRFIDKYAELLQAQLPETQLHPESTKGLKKAPTEKQLKREKLYGKQRVGKSDIGGKALKIPPVLIKKGSPLYEGTGERSGAKGTQPYIKKFKEELRTDLEAFKEAAGVRKVKQGEVLKTDRTLEQRQKGLVKFLNDKIAVELAAEYIESLEIAEGLKKQSIESLKGGNSRFSPSEKIQKDFYRKTGKNISLERLEKAQNDFLDLRKQMALEARDPELYEILGKHTLDITEAMQGKARNTNYISTVKAGTLDKTFINDFAKKFKLTKKDAANLLNKITEQEALEYTKDGKKYWREKELKEFQSSMLDMVENFFPKEMIDGLTIGQVEQLVGFAERVSAKGKELGISNKQRDISFNKAKLAEENSRLSDKTKKLISEVDWKNIKVQNIQGVFNSYNKKIQEGLLSEKKAKFEALKKLKPGERANYEKAQEAITSLKQDYIDFYSPTEKGETQKLEKALKYIYNLNKGNTNMVKGQRGNVWTEWFYVTEGHQGPSLKNPLYKERYNEALKFTKNKESWNKLVKNWKAKDQKIKTKEEYAAQKAKDFSKLKGEHLNPSAGESGRETLDVFSGKSGKPRTVRELLDNVQYQAPKGILDIVDKAFGPTATYATKRLALPKLIKYLKESYSWDAIEGKTTETLYDRVLDLARTDLLNLPGGKEIFKNEKLLENPNLKNAILEYGFEPSEANKLVIENIIDHIKNFNEIGKNTNELVKEANMSSKPSGSRTSASEKMSPKEGREKLRIRDKAFELARKINKPVKKARVFDFDDTVARTKSNVIYNKPNTTGKPSSGLKAIVMAGGPGSGKSTVIKKLGLQDQGYKVVNQDISLEWAKKLVGLDAKEAKYDAVQRSVRGELGALSRKIADKKLGQYTTEGKGVILDGTGASIKATEAKVKALKDKGYEVSMVYVETSKKTALDRNRNREERSLKDKIVETTWDSVNANKQAYKDKFGESFFEVDANKSIKELPSEIINKVNSKLNETIRGKITAEEFAKKGGEMETKGAKWDFSEFNKVVGGEKGPLFDVMKKMKEAAGERDLFILTARSPEAAEAIHKFLKEMGIDIPLENIKGLGDSSPIAKADYILDLAVKGYNDFYFADDHTGNVKAVKKVLDVIDVKGKVQRAIASKSRDLDKDFNKILESKSGIEWYKEYSKAKAEVVGAAKGKYKVFLPPGAEDFTGLIYSTLAKGKVGEAQLKWYNNNLIKPYNRATRSLASERVNMMADFKALKKQLNVPKELKKENETGFTNEQAARVYIWESQGIEVPGLSKKDLKELQEVVENNPTLQAFADQLQTITKGDLYTSPSKDWLSGTITTDLIELINTTKRNSYLEGWKQNVDIIYSEKNLNKLEAIYGRKYREALENSLTRMKTGRNRTSTGNKASDALLDYINGAQGTIMFLNMRSAVLQGISATNFVNLGFNNPIKAGKAFLNQKQYWKDFMEIMNSDYLVNRRNGLKLNISESEIADAAKSSTNKAKAVINYILEKGYAPTKFMDSFAIATGGATWYRNRIKDLTKKEGLSEAEAKKKAFEEFMEISEKSQQSSDPSKISKQQSSDMGRVFLQFVNTPMQYVRIQKRAAQDLANKRGDWKSNVSKILYYGVMQNLWFNAMQQGLFALGFGDDEINEKEEKKIINTANGMADSILRGTGFAGMTVSVLKNTIIDIYRRSGRQRPQYKDAWVKLLEFSPAVKSKFAKLKSAAYPFDTKEGRKQIKEKGFSLDNPAYESLAKVISAATNIPLDRVYSKYNNLSAMMSEDTEVWKDIALFLGWPEWQLEEGGTVKEDKIRNMKNDTKKEEQVQMLLDLGYSKMEIKRLKKEEDRVEAIIERQ